MAYQLTDEDRRIAERLSLAQTQKTQPKPKAKGNILTDLLPLVSGVGGAAIGSMILPGIGTAIGGALGSGAGRIAGNTKAGKEDVYEGAILDTLLGGIGGGGLSKLAKVKNTSKALKPTSKVTSVVDDLTPPTAPKKIAIKIPEQPTLEMPVKKKIPILDKPTLKYPKEIQSLVDKQKTLEQQYIQSRKPYRTLQEKYNQDLVLSPNKVKNLPEYKMANFEYHNARENLKTFLKENKSNRDLSAALKGEPTRGMIQADRIATREAQRAQKLQERETIRQAKETARAEKKLQRDTERQARVAERERIKVARQAERDLKKAERQKTIDAKNEVRQEKMKARETEAVVKSVKSEITAEYREAAKAARLQSLTKKIEKHNVKTGAVDNLSQETLDIVPEKIVKPPRAKQPKGIKRAIESVIAEKEPGLLDQIAYAGIKDDREIRRIPYDMLKQDYNFEKIADSPIPKRYIAKSGSHFDYPEFFEKLGLDPSSEHPVEDYVDYLKKILDSNQKNLDAMERFKELKRDPSIIKEATKRLKNAPKTTSAKIRKRPKTTESKPDDTIDLSFVPF